MVFQLTSEGASQELTAMQIKYVWILILTFLFPIGACSPSPLQDPGSVTPPALADQEDPQSTVLSEPNRDLVRQWAVDAEASSEFANPEWSAEQATGIPDAPRCGDVQFAWASAASDSIATLILRYERPVIPRQIIIYQSYNPDQVVKVEVFQEETQSFFTVLQKNPQPIDRPCPFQLEIEIEDISFPINQIRITVDQSQLGLGWNEIDAVELVGLED